MVDSDKIACSFFSVSSARDIFSSVTKAFAYNDASMKKQFFEGDKMLAWTLVVIFISLVLEKTIAFLIRRFGKHESYS